MAERIPDDPKQHPTGNAVKDPDDWVSGEEAMTGAQASYLQTLSEEAGAEFDPALSKADGPSGSTSCAPGRAAAIRAGADR